MRPLQVNVGSLTGDMISPPLSPNSDLNFNSISPSVLSALEYVSHKLQSKRLHLSFIVFREKPLPIGQGYQLHIVPISSLSDSAARIFNHYADRGARKMALRPDWVTRQPASHSNQALAPNWEYVVRRSMLQNDVLFGQEGLTLFNVDRVFTFKQQLNAVSRSATDHIPECIYLDSCMWLLQQILKETRGRPFTKGFFHCSYDHLRVRDDLLSNLAQEYAAKYGHDAIVLPPPKRAPKPEPSVTRTKARMPVRKSPDRRQVQASPMSAMKRQASKRLGPKTPNSASDVTPITKNEWQLVMEKAMDGIKLMPVQETENETQALTIL